MQVIEETSLFCCVLAIDVLWHVILLQAGWRFPVGGKELPDYTRAVADEKLGTMKVEWPDGMCWSVPDSHSQEAEVASHTGGKSNLIATIVGKSGGKLFLRFVEHANKAPNKWLVLRTEKEQVYQMTGFDMEHWDAATKFFQRLGQDYIDRKIDKPRGEAMKREWVSKHKRKVKAMAGATKGESAGGAKAKGKCKQSAKPKAKAKGKAKAKAGSKRQKPDAHGSDGSDDDNGGHKDRDPDEDEEDDEEGEEEEHEEDTEIDESSSNVKKPEPQKRPSGKTSEEPAGGAAEKREPTAEDDSNATPTDAVIKGGREEARDAPATRKRPASATKRPASTEAMGSSDRLVDAVVGVQPVSVQTGIKRFMGKVPATTARSSASTAGTSATEAPSADSLDAASPDARPSAAQPTSPRYRPVSSAGWGQYA